jgi:hypothetical protein
MSDDAGMRVIESGALAATHALEALGQVAGDTGQVLGGLGDTFGAIARGNLVDFASGLHSAAEGLANMSDEADRQERAIRALGDGMDAISRQTSDTVDETDAWRMQQRLLTAGLHATGEELGAVAGFAREYALAHGVTATEATERLTSALIRGAAGGLRPFGIEVDHNATRAENWHAALGQVATNLARTGVSARTAGEEIHRFDRELGDAENDLGRSAATALHLTDVMHGLTDIIQNTGNVATTMGRAINAAMHFASGDIVGARAYYNAIGAEERGVAAQRQQAEAAQQAAQHEAVVASDAARARGINLARVEIHSAEDLVQLTNTLRTYQGASLEVQQQQVDAIGEQRRLEGLRARDAAAYRENANNAEANALGTAPHTTRAHHGGGGGGRAANDNAADRAALAHIQETLHAHDELRQHAYTREKQEYLHQEAGTLAERNHADEIEKAAINADLDEKAAMFRRVEAQEKAHLNHLEDLRVQDRNAMSVGWAEALHLNESSTLRMASFTTSMYSTMGAAAKQGIAAVIEQQATGGEALRAFGHQVSMALGMEAGERAVMEFAAGWAMVGRAAGEEGLDPGADSSATAHFVSAALYAGLAGAGFGIAAATNAPKSASSGSSGAPSSAARANGPANDNAYAGGGNTYITVTGSIVDTAGFTRATGHSLNELYGSRQQPPQMRAA